jgi:hypothetical protein
MNTVDSKIVFLDTRPTDESTWKQRQRWVEREREKAKWLKKKLGFFNGLQFFSRTNESHRFLLVSRHWTYCICWSWFLEYSTKPRRFFRFQKLWNDSGWTFQFLWLGMIGFHKQDNDWMIR